MRAWLRRNRLGVSIALGLVVVLTLLAVLTARGNDGPLDPDSYTPEGSHALAVLLEDAGVEVVRTGDVPSTLAAAGEDTTVFLPLPHLLGEEELQELNLLEGDLVVTTAGEAELDAIGADTDVDEAEQRVREPGCDLPLARNAGAARTGGLRYLPRGAGTTSCYGGSLVVLPASELVVLADPSPLTNEHLDEDGNAALALGLLGAKQRVAWVVPDPARAPFGQKPLLSPDEVLPDWVISSRTQLLVVLLVVAAWRVRRLGPVVEEPLPVVVRASETVEGHGRLYHAAGARDSAAEALRAAARRSLTRLVHGGPSPAPDVLSAMAARRAGRDPVAVRELLYGPPPADDAGLVRLAERLDSLTTDALAERPREAAGS